ncbi:MAG: hypothetical protein M3O61_13775 [Gemmatimonadota bacterium]|nr:hypothetical protein [Gemmatimonadota bacterium]
MQISRSIAGALLTLVFVVALPAVSRAQASPELRERLRSMDSTIVVTVSTVDGSSIVGRVVAANDSSIQVQTSGGLLTIPFTSIRTVQTASQRAAEGWFPNPNDTRLFFAPTGRMLKKGEGYFSVYQLFLPGVAYGVTDNFTIGGGVSVVPTGLENQIYYITPKVGMSVGEKVHLGAGVLVAGAFRGGDDFGGIFYGVGTYGTSDASVTGGLGYGFVGEDVASEPLGMIGGEKRISRRVALVTENYFVTSGIGDPLISGGVRFMSEKLTVDFALFSLLGNNDTVPFFPWIDFVFKF